MPSSVAVDPIHVAHSKHSGIGAVLDNINIEDPSEAELEEIRQALGKYHVICIRKKTLSPEKQIALNKRIDKRALDIHGHGKSQHSTQNTVLRKNGGARIPRAMAVQVIGNGHFEDYEGIDTMDLIHVHHSDFHHSPLTTKEEESGQTRFYRWHIDWLK